ncbi:GTPase/DUF3482 domain-containing protein [Marinomonas ostreistagni]|uniref:GTPase/DUF3482 domain-containing protein n=1 Tax=Marinomonas ostreistagni TaxID=359209 RepID=UPI00194F71A8|nr:GTPase/DUF3482 domain-containing protein [Marinomonas ostreistagni]MBM6551005.1 DUF3482 domain-containing protein [Marinomonas ostreistagni]
MSISLLIVGHANTGKTSLIRTMLRDHNFGEVQNYSGTTRHVEQISLTLNDAPLLDLIDTPGFEDSIGLWQTRVQDYADTSNERWLEAVQSDSALQDDFEQELKILKQLSRCDIILYVIDLRQAPLGKYLDELNILACANKPIVPILNFCNAEQSHESEWRRCLAERQLHAHVRYDTVAFFLADERKLYQTLQSLAPDEYDTLQALINQREQDAAKRLTQAKQALSHALIDCTTSQFVCASTTPSASEKQAFEQHIRQREQAFVSYCLRLYDFRHEDVVLRDLPLQEGQWQQDIFDPDTLKSWGINTSTSAATGAAIGAGIDILSAGLTLGTATTLGAILGAGVQTGRSFKTTLMNKLRKRSVLALNPDSSIALLYRGIQLIAHLHQRGHASQQAYQGQSDTLPDKQEVARLEKLFARISQRPEWHQANELPDHELVTALQQAIDEALPTSR